ncbi:MAG TPA: alginate lyase family protein [Pyrinomonadaceae bacterium]|nr:alginate lyase family protein [Pyrinomonadaceae bacterium]
MAVLKKIKRAVRGEVKLTTAAREVLRRTRASVNERKERAGLFDHEPLALKPVFARMNDDELLAHFQGPRQAKFLDGFRFENDDSIASANRIVDDHCWPLLGFGERCFGKSIQWAQDPLSDYVWPLDYHRDIKLLRGDGSDVRVLWELNRLGHFLPLASAYSSTKDVAYATEFWAQLRSWIEQNPYGRGPNWTCAMEVALRSMNLLAGFEALRHSPDLDAASLRTFLQLLQQHANYIQRNLEFSYIATSNHYLSDVVGLTWLGLLLSELRDAEQWFEFGRTEMLREMDKQVLADGADFEASTGYHRFVTELFLYTFWLARSNNVKIEEKYWAKLKQMLIYVRAYLRPDGFAPLIGDTDSGQVLPFVHRRADDHAYLLEIGAKVFDDPTLAETQQVNSQAFPQAGTYIMRDGDLYLCFNTSGAGINGRGSHGHNDALSIEVSASGRAFIVDPGTYVYSADLAKRHEFRSTAYHSTVQIDGLEQNTIDVQMPFVIGNEARPRVLEWKTDADSDKVIAEHYGYPVVHRRTVIFNKRERFWLIDDEFFGDGEHVYEARFHLAPGAAGLMVSLLNHDVEPVLESQPVSRDYGQMSDAVSMCWRISGRPGKLSWQIKSV